MTERSDNGRRVVVTGIGMVTPVGNDRDSSWAALVAGTSGAGPLETIDPTGLPITFACEAKDFDPSVALDRKTVRRTDRFVQFAIVAAREAMSDARLEVMEWTCVPRRSTSNAPSPG